MTSDSHTYSNTELARLGNNVGMLLSIMGEFSEAEEALLRALDRLKDVSVITSRKGNKKRKNSSG